MTEFEKKLIGVAMVCHEANRAFCKAIGDNSQVPWDEAAAWQQSSAVDGVRFHMKKPRTVEESHLNWMAEKLATGWQYGPVKDVEKKEHPCLVEYKDLPYEQQFKDALFMSVVMALSPLIVDAIGRDHMAKLKGEV